MNGIAPKVACEVVGTFMLCFIGAGSVIIDHNISGIGLLGIAIANGLVLSVAASATMSISGAHFNPAVTIAMLATGRIKPPGAAVYIGSQIAGAFLAAITLKTIIFGVPGGPESIAATGLGATVPGADISAQTALITEVVLTFILVFVIFGTAVDDRAPAIGGFGIGLAVAANIMLGGPISGASMNPARTLGPGLVGGVWDAHWIYWVGPIIGALAAAFLYHFVILDKAKN